MSLSSISSVDVVGSNALLVRDDEGQYRLASAEEVLQQARRVLSQRVRRGATMSSPQASGTRAIWIERVVSGLTFDMSDGRSPLTRAPDDVIAT
jgi:hypothetical protein